jgi:uroporphyrinogen-III synthase
MTGLRGARIGVLESRRGGELAELVRRRGGEPISAPALREEPTEARAEVGALVEALAAEPDPVVVLTTGVGVSTLLADARAAACHGELVRLLSRVTVACRGPKPAAALAREGLRADVHAASPYTEKELLEALAPVPLAGRLAALVHHGERSASLAAALAARGARVRELTLYAWRLPDDVAPLRELIREILAARIRAILFTSQAQARHLFLVAEAMGEATRLRDALAAHTAVASVGPTCTGALDALGVRVDVAPARPKMGQLVTALEHHLTTEGTTR